MATMPPSNNIVPMLPSDLRKPSSSDKENDEAEDDGIDNLNQQGHEDEDGGRKDEHDPSDDDDDDDGGSRKVGIRHPHINDVLCGRGGLTNNHPGNEWFRKLVRSNRPLYHACPKHTKLLVSKAIVQAVQAQDPPGRFLERNKKDKMWYSVGYKKAVDKTSQGLREKERGDEVYQAPLPPMLANRSKVPANLHDLARVTMARAGLDPILPQKNQNNKRPPPPPVEKEAPNNNIASSKRPKMMLPTKSALKPKTTSPPAPPVATTPTLQEWDDPLPLPTQPLQVRQSSMFRFLSQTVLLNDPNPSNYNGSSMALPAAFSRPSTSFMSAPAVAAAYAASQASKAPAAHGQWFYGPSMPPPLPPPPLSTPPPHSSQPPTFSPPTPPQSSPTSPPAPPAIAESTAIAPPAESTVLTRLTSQFSDLFATFWPQSSSNTITTNYQHRQGESNQTAAETAVTMMKFATVAAPTSLTETDSCVIDGDAENLTPLPLTYSKSASSLPTICNDDEDDGDGDDGENTEHDVKPVILPPSELERSASAFLLELAANLTGFFPRSTTTIARVAQPEEEDANEEDIGPVDPYPAIYYGDPPKTMAEAAASAAAARGRPVVTTMPPAVGPVGRKTTRSLLDDDDDTEREWLMRRVGSG